MVVCQSSPFDVFLFKQKTAYELRISDWSSDVCSSDLVTLADMLDVQPITVARLIDKLVAVDLVERRPDPNDRRAQRLFLTTKAAGVPIGRASCRERVCQYV